MKSLFLILVLAISLFGAETATKEDIKELKELILSVKTDLQREMDKRFEAIDKRFEAVDKRFEAMEKRFEAMEKRFESVDKRFDITDKNNESRFASLEKRIDDVNTYMATMIVGMFGMIGFIWWDRRTMIERAKVEVKEEVTKEFSEAIAKKADKQIVDRILEIFENLAKNDKEIEEVLKKHNFRPV